MSESFPAKNAKPIPPMTALSTAFPLQFESTAAKPAADTRTPAAKPPRVPHRHDAGE